MTRVFLAGATGAVGRPLCRVLVANGYHVTGTTRSSDKTSILRDLGVEPVVVDVFDAEALRRAVLDARPDIVIHQLTDLPPALEPTRMEAALVRTGHLRDVGTRNLIAAAVEAGAKRMIVQSISFAYAPAALPHTEDLPLVAPALAAFENQVLEAPVEGIVLRYGKFYGPGTGFDAPAPGGPLHVDDAAHAAFLALTRGAPGVYNIAEDDGSVSTAKAQRELGWAPGSRIR
jgi:nucleoside-diphosphate-sugar epimerase